MMTFRVGMKVVCVDASGWSAESVLVKGAIYTVLYTNRLSDGILGVSCPPINNLPGAQGWQARRFRPIVDTKSEISFTQGAPKDSERFDNRRKVGVDA